MKAGWVKVAAEGGVEAWITEEAAKPLWKIRAKDARSGGRTEFFVNGSDYAEAQEEGRRRCLPSLIEDIVLDRPALRQKS